MIMFFTAGSGYLSHLC